MKRRYLLSFSYLGNHFQSCSRDGNNLSSVVGALEDRLQRLKNTSLASNVVVSSRTDRGVHAIQNTAHVDLLTDRELSLTNVLDVLNKFYRKNNIGLRVSAIRQVADDFNARKFARFRTYLYRIAVPKYNFDCIDPYTPISEVTRCYFLRKPGFDIDAVQKGLSLLIGTHNFLSFTGKPSKQTLVRTPIRRIFSFTINQGAPLMCDLHEPFSNNFDYWDFIVEGRSFNYRQVRRMIGALVAVGQGKFSCNGLQRMLDLEVRSDEWIMSIIAPACGLYLMKVTYNEDDLAVNRKQKQCIQEYSNLMFLLKQRELCLKV